MAENQLCEKQSVKVKHLRGLSDQSLLTALHIFDLLKTWLGVEERSHGFQAVVQAALVVAAWAAFRGTEVTQMEYIYFLNPV